MIKKLGSFFFLVATEVQFKKENKMHLKAFKINLNKSYSKGLNVHLANVYYFERQTNHMWKLNGGMI